MADSVSGTLGWSYDSFDQVTAANSPQGTITYGYDAAGRRTKMQAATQAPVVYGYDTADRLTGITQGPEKVIFAYDPANRRITQTLPNHVQTAYTYNNANQVTGLAWGKAGQAALGSLGYGYNSVGQLVAQTGTHASQSLPPASSGNSFDDNNRQTKANNVALSYDESGHLLNDGSRKYVWDDRDRLSEIQQGGTTIASFSYDALGRRTVKTEGGTSTQYLYDGEDVVQETQGSTVNPILTGLGIDQRYARNDTGGRTYFLTDQLGSTRLLTNAAGGVVQRYEYDPYGATAQSSTAYTNPYQYTGREKDSSGLYYYRARYYQPQLGRFISEDPIGLAGGANSYVYVGSAPTIFIDPLGLDRVVTYQNLGFTAYYDNKGNYVNSWPSRSAVASNSKPGAAGPYHSDNVYPSEGPYHGRPTEYGPNDILKTDDGRGRWLHGGGTGLVDPQSPRQGWKPTLGCTRMQNEDIQQLVDLVREVKSKNPSRAITYDRYDYVRPTIVPIW
ncbi:RHS repeat-associated core domain-containing protein [Xanthomonas fragariae]|uniref:RHS repeat-associated core domain-containing protein n=1 Tax=Xanthomonas fragariae TaxID=48664 RepID=UPI0022AB2C4F|nr:RHS repeat-associated core domain-containing protein [Xanthomonas fragariae]WAT14759.1 L,D-transpeptidase family protein [Xanthomonas fragariae]